MSLSQVRPFALGRTRAPSSDEAPAPFALPPHHLVTHGVIVGMTGSGKTGLCIGLVEEAIRSRIPILLLDVKGDLPNLALAFDALDAPSFLRWVDVDAAKRQGTKPEAVAAELASKWTTGLASWGLGPADVAALRASAAIRLITPGTTAGEPLHVLSPLEVRSDLWELDEEAAREALSAAISLLLRMIDRDPDPSRGREHVLLAHLAERRLRAGDASGLEALLGDLQAPPLERIGALSVDEFLSPKERAALATDLNALVASPTFASWRKGAPLDVGAWMSGLEGDDRVPVTIVSVAHLEDEERMLVLGLVLEQTLAWVRGLSGTTDLRALVMFDEVFGFLPPHPANPPTKRPMLALLKQARAFGVGCVLATQNPIDLDYKALSNAGVWMVGRLQTDADRERVVEGLVGSEAAQGDTLDGKELASILKALPPRTFFFRDVHAGNRSLLLETRWTLSWLRGPMTRKELKKLVAEGRVLPPREEAKAVEQKPVLAAAPSAPEGWRVLYPHPPKAPVDAWQYLPHAAVIARAEVVDAKLGVRTTREVGVMVPFANGGLDLDGAVRFEPDSLTHGPVAGARYVPYGELGTRALRSIEKALKEQAL
ncbi:MAG: ATP-binding protein, partial [Polyangiales bacterium]